MVNAAEPFADAPRVSAHDHKSNKCYTNKKTASLIILNTQINILNLEFEINNTVLNHFRRTVLFWKSKYDFVCIRAFALVKILLSFFVLVH